MSRTDILESSPYARGKILSYLLSATAMFLVSALSPISVAASPKKEAPTTNMQDWRVYGGNADGTRYSTLQQINRDTVKQLRVAWEFPAGADGALQTNPLIVGRTMFVYTTT